jgi:hypothetical protein
LPDTPTRPCGRMVRITRSASATTLAENTFRAMQVLLSITICLAPASGFAQGQLLGVVHGIVTDQQGGVLPGVLITATPVESRPPVTASTDATGFYALKELPPGEYQLKAELAGFATTIQPGVVARAGLTLSIDLAMPVGGLDEVVTVRRDAPLLDTRSAEQSFNLTGELQRLLPLSSTRQWFDFFNVTPGAAAAATTQVGATLAPQTFIYGADRSSNVVQLDGADIGSAQNNLVQYVSFNSDIIADIHITTAGVPASKPLGQGAAVSITTKSGTNRLQGSASLLFRPMRWSDANNPGGTSAKTRFLQPDISVGGPIALDRMWFFGAYRYVSATTDVSRTADQVSLLRTLLPHNALPNNETRAHQYFVKVNTQLTPGHQVSGFYQADTTPYEIAGPISEFATKNKIGGPGAAVRLSSGLSPSLFLQAGVSYNAKTFSAAPLTEPEPQRLLYRSTVGSGGVLSGNGILAVLSQPGMSWFSQPYSKITYTLDITKSLQARKLGTHDITAGTYLQPRIHRESITHYPNSGFALEELVLRDPGDLQSPRIPFHRQVSQESGTTVLSNTSDYAAYVQDSWRPTNRLTISLGVRVDHVIAHDDIFQTTTQRSTDIGPRIGVNYLLTADARNIVRGFWNRVHETPTAAGANPGIVTLQRDDTYDLNLDGTFETQLTTPGSTVVSLARAIDPDLHQPHVDEWSLGYQRQLPREIGLDVSIIRRAFTDRLGAVETNRLYEESVFSGYRDTTQTDIYQLTNNRWNRPVYLGLSFAVTRQTKRLQTILTYLRQWRHLEGTWQPGDPAAFIQPGTFPNERGIGSTVGNLTNTNDANSLSGTTMALSTTGSPWADHVFRTSAAYAGPWASQFSVSYVLQTGSWSGPIITRVSASDPQFGPPLIRLPDGRTAQNPLATTNRFAHSTRSEGQFQLPTYHAVNIRAGRRFTLGGASVDILADLYNAANADTDQGMQSGGNQTFSPNYRLLTTRQPPRAGVLTIRVGF